RKVEASRVAVLFAPPCSRRGCAAGTRSFESRNRLPGFQRVDPETARLAAEAARADPRHRPAELFRHLSSELIRPWAWTDLKGRTECATDCWERADFAFRNCAWER